MEAFTRLTATPCPLGLANVDTDQLIPARFMKRSRADGYGGYLLHDLRFDEAGQLRLDFILNQPAHGAARILVVRRNFGTGSSREAAVYALWDYGIRCVIAPSFGDIFASNAVKNGLLPAIVSDSDAEFLLAGDGELTVDLDAMTITSGESSIPFSIDPVRRLQLLNGWDDIDLTHRHAAEIAAFRTTLAAHKPWSWPRRA